MGIGGYPATLSTPRCPTCYIDMQYHADSGNVKAWTCSLCSSENLGSTRGWRGDPCEENICSKCCNSDASDTPKVSIVLRCDDGVVVGLSLAGEEVFRIQTSTTIAM